MQPRHSQFSQGLLFFFRFFDKLDNTQKLLFHLRPSTHLESRLAAEISIKVAALSKILITRISKIISSREGLYGDNQKYPKFG